MEPQPTTPAGGAQTNAAARPVPRRSNRLILGGVIAAVAMIAATMVVAAGPVGAATLDVCPVGCTYSLIKDAVNAAAANDTITVGPGTYNENDIRIIRPVKIIGADRDTVIVSGGNAIGVNNVFYVAPPSSGVAGTIEMSGMTIKDPPRATATGTAFSVILKMNSLTTPVTSIDMTDMIIYGGDTTDYLNYGVYALSGVTGGVHRSPPPLNFDQLDVRRHRNQGILIEDWRAAVTLTNSVFDRGLNATPSSDFLVHSSLGTDRFTDPFVLRNNEFEGSGVWFSGCYLASRPVQGGFDSITIDSNRFYGLQSTDTAINVGGSSCGVAAPVGMTDITKTGAVSITNNVIEGSGDTPGVDGVRVTGAADSVAITDNSITGLARAINVRSDPSGSPTAIAVNRNRLFADVVGVLNDSTAPIDATENWWGCLDGPESGSSFCSSASGTGLGTIDASTWIRPAATLAPVTLAPSGTAAGTTTLATLNNDTSIALPAVFDGIPVSWTAPAGPLAPPRARQHGGDAPQTEKTPPPPPPPLE